MHLRIEMQSKLRSQNDENNFIIAWFMTLLINQFIMLHPNTKNYKNTTTYSSTASLSTIQPTPKPNLQKIKTQSIQNADSGFHKKFSLQGTYKTPYQFSHFPQKQNHIAKNQSTPNFQSNQPPLEQNSNNNLQLQRNKPLVSQITKLTPNDSYNTLPISESQVVEVGNYDIKVSLPKSNNLNGPISQQQFLQNINQTSQANSKVHSNANIMTVPSQMSKSNILNRSTIFNDTRIRLRDYLFMANTSTTLAAQKKRTILQSSKTSIQQTLDKKKQAAIPKDQARKIAKNSYAKQKYQISTNKMANILKTEISNDIVQLKSKINEIESWVSTLEAKDNDQLTKLYSIRRQIQNYYSNLNVTFPPISSLNDLPLNESIQFLPQSQMEQQPQSQFMEI